MSKNELLKSSRIEGYYDQLLNAIDLEFSKSTGHVPIEKWVEKVKLPSGPFTFQNHEYQKAILQEDGIRQVLKKGTQLGISETQILKSIYGLLYGRYPQWVLYLFPTQNDVYDFSRARFGPLLMDNPEIGKEVRETESVTLKRVRKSMLYLRGARASSKIEGVKAMATQLLAIPVDRIVFDERDNMADNMIDLALERLGHSSVKEEVYLGTPSIPDYGVDRLYNNDSDQRVWEIKCSHCNTETVLEIEFPSCLVERSNGSVYRACKKNKDHEIFPKDGHWVAQYPSRSKDWAGWWISRLNSAYADLKKILRTFQDPSNRNLAEFYNSTLAMAYIAAENRLTVQDVYSCCGQEAMAMNHKGPCAMGVDVGSLLNVVVGFKPKDKQLQICYLARVSSFNDVHDIAQRFNVKYCVIDLEPELRKAREFAQVESYPVFLADYQDHVVTGPVWDEEKGLVKVNRTEVCDISHDLISSSGLILSRRSEEVEVFAKQCANIAKVLQEDPETGSREYRYRKLGEDHYRHALNYFWLASQRIGLLPSAEELERRRLLEMVQRKDQDYNPLTFGLESEPGPDNYNPLMFGFQKKGGGV
jgi:hypothetical protein